MNTEALAGTGPLSVLQLGRALTSDKQNAGFTLIELIVVMLLVSILAYVALPRFFNQLSFREWGFTDELSAALRFAHKYAFTSGCDTAVQLTPSGYILKQRNNCRYDPAPGADNAFDRPLRLPGGSGTGYSGTAPAGVVLSTVSFYYDRIGRPHDIASASPLAAVTSIMVGTRLISVEAETGYVH